MAIATVTAAGEYPARFDVEYPEGPRNRLTVAIRFLLILPVAVVLTLLTGGGGASGGEVAAAGGVVIAPTVLMLLFRRKYPRWWFDWSRELSRFGTRVGAYLFLLRDEYPSTDEEQAVHLKIDYPDAQQLNRWLPLVKWLLAIPHYIVLVFLGIGVVLAWIASWVMILVTGSQPRGLFDYTVGVGRWCSRVSGYAFMLVTDRYPPFSLK